MNKKDINLRCVDFGCNEESFVPAPKVSKVSGKEWMAFGDNNDMPQVYKDTVEECSTLGSVVDMISTYICGAGIQGDREIDEQGTMLSELLEKIVYDYISTGAFAVQLLRNPYGELTKLAYVDINRIRLNEDGNRIFYNKNWGKYTRDTRVYDRWVKESISDNSIMYVKNPKTRELYGKPLWHSSLRDALTMIEASKSNYNSILNQFSPNTLISFNQGVPDPETKDEMEKAIIGKYTGSRAAKIFVTWSDSQDTAPTLQSFSAEDYTDKYNAVMESAKQNILTSFRVSPQLVGIATQTGFTSQEYKDAFELLYSTQIQPMQRYIEKQFKKLNINFTFNKFEVDFKDNKQETPVM